MKAVLITRGSRGMALFEAGRPTIHVPIYGSDEVADVTGAGDTVIATMTLAIAAGGSFYEAARLANYAGGLVVMKRGTATVSPDELASGGRRDQRSTENWERELVDQRSAELADEWLDRAQIVRGRGAVDDRVRERLLRRAACRPRAVPCRCGGAGRSADRRGQRR